MYYIYIFIYKRHYDFPLCNRYFQATLWLMTRGIIRGLLSAWYDDSDIFRANPFISACAENRTPATRGFAEDFFFLFIWLSFGQPKWAVLFFQEQPPLGFNLWVWERCIVCLAKEREWNPHRLRLAEFWPTSRAHPRKDSCPWTNLRDTMAVGKQSSWRAKPRRRRRPGLFANAFFWPPSSDPFLESSAS